MATRVFLSSLFRSTARGFPLSRPSPTNALLSRFSDYSSAVVVKTEVQIKSMFEDWMKYHKKSYPSEKEKKRRFKIFKAKVLWIDKENRKWELKGDDLRFGLNDSSDLTHEEFRKTHYGCLPPDARYVRKEI